MHFWTWKHVYHCIQQSRPALVIKVWTKVTLDDNMRFFYDHYYQSKYYALQHFVYENSEWKCWINSCTLLYKWQVWKIMYEGKISRVSPWHTNNQIFKTHKDQNFIQFLNLCKSKSNIIKTAFSTHHFSFLDNYSIIIIIEPIQIPCLTNLGSTTSKTTLLMAFNALGVSKITCIWEICGYKILSIYFTTSIICLLCK